MWNLDELSGKAVSLTIAIVVGISLGLRQVFSMREDRRKDKAGVRGDDAEDKSAKAYRQIIEDQDGHIDRLEGRVTSAENAADAMREKNIEMSDRVRQEIDNRYNAERLEREALGKAAGLQARIEELEEKLSKLK